MYWIIGDIITGITFSLLLYILLFRKDVRKYFAENWDDFAIGWLYEEIGCIQDGLKAHYKGEDIRTIKELLIGYAMVGLCYIALVLILIVPVALVSFLIGLIYPLVLLIIVVVVLFFLIEITINIIKSHKRELLYKEKRQRKKEDKEFWGKNY